MNPNSEDQEKKGTEKRRGKRIYERERETTPEGNCDAVEDEAPQGL